MLSTKFTFLNTVSSLRKLRLSAYYHVYLAHACVCTCACMNDFRLGRTSNFVCFRLGNIWYVKFQAWVESHCPVAPLRLDADHQRKVSQSMTPVKVLAFTEFVFAHRRRKLEAYFPPTPLYPYPTQPRILTIFSFNPQQLI